MIYNYYFKIHATALIGFKGESHHIQIAPPTFVQLEGQDVSSSLSVVFVF